MKRYFRTTFVSLRSRNFRLYFFGQSVSQIGTWTQKIAQAWLVKSTIARTRSLDFPRHV